MREGEPRGRSAMEEVANCLDVCPECGGALQGGGKSVVASVLLPAGWRQVRHLAKRCRRQGCLRVGKLLWYNFLSMTVGRKQERRFEWGGSELCFPGCGVSVEWLQQMTRRVTHQYSTFKGEAAVHLGEARARGMEEVVPNRADMKLWRCWLYWRLVVRQAQYEEVNGERVVGVDLQQPFAVTLQNASWYNEFMFQRRVESVQEAQLRVMDGNQKLSGRFCGRPCAEVLRAPCVGYYTSTACSRRPRFKSKRCAAHQPQPVQGFLEAEVVVAHRWLRGLQTEARPRPTRCS